MHHLLVHTNQNIKGYKTKIKTQKYIQLNAGANPDSANGKAHRKCLIQVQKMIIETSSSYWLLLALRLIIDDCTAWLGSIHDTCMHFNLRSLIIVTLTSAWNAC